MALTTFRYGIYPPLTTFSGSAASQTLDADGEKLGCVVRAPKTGNVRKVWFRIGSTTTADDLRISLQDVDAATGFPDEVVDQSQTITLATSDDSIWKTATMDADRSVTRQDPIAVVFEFNPWVDGNIAITLSTSDEAPNQAYSAAKTGGSWAKLAAQRSPILALEYDDGNVYPIHGAQPALGAFTSFNSSSNPKERGMRFRVPWEVQIAGGVFYGDPNEDLLMALYDDSGSTTPLVTTNTVESAVGEDTIHNPIWCRFSSPYTLSPNTYYRFLVRPLTTTDIAILRYTAPQASLLGGFYGGQDFHYAELSSSNVWSTDTAVRFAGSLWIRQVHP